MIDINYFKVRAPLDGNHFTLAFGKDRSKMFRKMFSKFKIEKPQHVQFQINNGPYLREGGWGGGGGGGGGG